MAPKNTNYLSRETARYLQSCYQDTGLYDTLSFSTISNWIDESTAKYEWLPCIARSISFGTFWNPNINYRSILDGKTELINQVKDTLLSIQQASLVANANLARAIILGYIQTDAQELLGEEGQEDHFGGGESIF